MSEEHGPEVIVRKETEQEVFARMEAMLDYNSVTSTKMRQTLMGFLASLNSQTLLSRLSFDVQSMFVRQYFKKHASEVAKLLGQLSKVDRRIRKHPFIQFLTEL